MSTNQKEAGIFGGAPSVDKEQLLQKFYGDRLLSSVGAGAGLGLGAAALYHLLRNAKPSGKKEKKYTNYGTGTPMIAKAAVDTGSIGQTLGGMLPKTMVPFGAPSVGGGPAPSADPHLWRKSWSTAANIGGAALGTAAGAHLINSIMKAKKKKDQAAALEAARAEYYAALTGKQASALDAAFEKVKQANMLSSAVSALWNTPQTLRTAYLLTLLGAGGLGGKYMYDRTKELTTGENLAKAQASRARMKGLPPVWVDPESLAQVKSTVESNE